MCISTFFGEDEYNYLPKKMPGIETDRKQGLSKCQQLLLLLTLSKTNML